MTALLIYPTHKNCREAEQEFLDAGISAATYPGRRTTESEGMPKNCWNEDADWAEGMGLPVVKTVCPICPVRAKCSNGGYLGALKAAQDATVTLCTHKRAEFAGLAELTKGREYVSIHENPINLLRPAVRITEQDLFQVQRILNDPRFRSRFADDRCIDDDGNCYPGEEQKIRIDRQQHFLRHLIRMIDALVVELKKVDITTECSPKHTMKCPTGIERSLFVGMQITGATFQGPAWQFVLAAASGQLEPAAILIDKKFVKGEGQGGNCITKSLIGFRDNPPGNGVTWFNDATLSQGRLEKILGRPVQDMTPGDGIERRKKAVQVLRDITRSTKSRIFKNILRGVMADRPHSERIGVICHRPHVSAAKSLGADFDPRIVKVAYFGSGEDRSSNDWIKECDLIIVAGTPRVPPGVVAAYLIQIGEVGAACREPVWGTVYWEGQTESEERKRVESLGYEDAAWQAAYRELVSSQLVQAIGRGRGILESGCEVVVLSTEECGLLVSDASFKPLSEGSTTILEAMHKLTTGNSNNIYLEPIRELVRNAMR